MIWKEAQTLITQRVTQTREQEETTLPHIPERREDGVLQMGHGNKLIFTRDKADTVLLMVLRG